MLKSLEDNLETLFETIKLEEVSLELKDTHQSLKVIVETKNPIVQESSFAFFRNFLKAKMLVFGKNVLSKAKNNFWHDLKAIEKESFVFESQDVYSQNQNYISKEKGDILKLVFEPKLIFPRPLKDVYTAIVLYVDYKALGETQNVSFEKIYEHFGAKSLLLQLYDQDFNPKILTKYKPVLSGNNFVPQEEIYQGAYTSLSPRDKFDIQESGFYPNLDPKEVDWVVGSELYQGKTPRVATERFQFLKETSVDIANVSKVFTKEEVLNVTPVKDKYSVDVYPNMLVFSVSKDFLKDELTGNLQKEQIESLSTLQGGVKKIYTPKILEYGKIYYLIVPNHLKNDSFEVILNYSLFSQMNKKPLRDSSLYVPHTSFKTTNAKRDLRITVKRNSFRTSNKKVSFALSKTEAEAVYNPANTEENFFADVLGGLTSQTTRGTSSQTPLDFNKSDLEVVLPQKPSDFLVVSSTTPQQTITFEKLTSASLTKTTLRENWQPANILQKDGIYRAILNNTEEFRFIAK